MLKAVLGYMIPIYVAAIVLALAIPVVMSRFETVARALGH